MDQNRSQNQPDEQQQQLPELSLGYPLQPPAALLPLPMHPQQIIPEQLSLGFLPQPAPPLPLHQQYQLDILWQNQKDEVENMTEFKSHPLPVTRIRRAMKGCPGVQLVSSDAPVLIAKACEMFVHDLTLRSWMNAEENAMSTIQPLNIYNAICHAEQYKFLIEPNAASGSASTEVTSASYYPTSAGGMVMPVVVAEDHHQEQSTVAPGPTGINPQNYF